MPAVRRRVAPGAEERRPGRAAPGPVAATGQEGSRGPGRQPGYAGKRWPTCPDASLDRVPPRQACTHTGAVSPGIVGWACARKRGPAATARKREPAAPSCAKARAGGSSWRECASRWLLMARTRGAIGSGLCDNMSDMVSHGAAVRAALMAPHGAAVMSMDTMLGRAQRGAPRVPGQGMRAADDRLLTATYGKEGGRTRVSVCASGAGARGAARSARGSVGGGGDRHRVANREPEQLTDQQLCVDGWEAGGAD